ncbi:uncharacterized protein LOC110181809 [Drosophila serrata]|uniref:uncharacterized protein LOC110181809 n=1 Tax=Drosophila serrata TaxID=7274 RepID=UPI000A1D2485|nr:uncharacterized protein LOC110181809 [Drosophila serrata]KAH8356540.1 hypothetical protein KR200_001093 [Drosophila serrata]
MMEARRLEKQRRESAKSKAASQLPSSQEQEFNLRLIDLYKSKPCLWNTSLTEHSDAERKNRAWEEIAAGMGSHLSPAFVRSRMRSLRYKLNLYKLQLIEFQMMPGKATGPPVKPYFVDRLDFLDVEATSSTEPPTVMPPDSTSPETMGNLWSNFDLKKPLETLTKLTRDAPTVPQTGSSIAATVKQRLENQLPPMEFLKPRGTITRQQKERNLRSSGLRGESSSGSSMVVSDTPPKMQARPGDSISVTKLEVKRQMQKQNKGTERPSTSRRARESVESEDEELYSLHWNMRRERRSLRQGGVPHGQDQTPVLPAHLRSNRYEEPNPDLF